MEEMFSKRKQTLCNSTTTSNSTSSALAIQKNSHAISKAITKPKIRIIHIFAPEIIKTDVANFRELVQRLTGKPSENSCQDDKAPERIGGRKDIHEAIKSGEKMKNKDEKNIWQWQGETTSGGFLGDFSELDGIMQGFGEYPLLPLDSSHMQAF